jgi:hypothetical protein
MFRLPFLISSSRWFDSVRCKVKVSAPYKTKRCYRNTKLNLAAFASIQRLIFTLRSDKKKLVLIIQGDQQVGMNIKGRSKSWNEYVQFRLTLAGRGACLTGRVPCLARQGELPAVNLGGRVPCPAGREAASSLGPTGTTPWCQSTYDWRNFTRQCDWFLHLASANAAAGSRSDVRPAFWGRSHRVQEWHNFARPVECKRASCDGITSNPPYALTSRAMHRQSAAYPRLRHGELVFYLQDTVTIATR